MGEKISVTGAYFIGLDEDRNIFLFETNQEDYGNDLSRPRKYERVEVNNPRLSAVIEGPLVGGLLSLTSGLVEDDHGLVGGHEDNYPLAQINLAREIREELEISIDPNRLIPFSKVGGNNGRREQVVPQIRDNILYEIWSIGFWLPLARQEAELLGQKNKITKVPIDHLADFLLSHQRELRPSTAFFLWEMLQHELELV
jgi:hypothetical protein